MVSGSRPWSGATGRLSDPGGLPSGENPVEIVCPHLWSPLQCQGPGLRLGMEP